MSADSQRTASVRLVPYVGTEIGCVHGECPCLAEVVLIDIQDAPILHYCVQHWTALRDQEAGVRLLVDVTDAAHKHIATRPGRLKTTEADQ